MVVVLVVLVGIGAYFLYKNSVDANRAPEVVEEKGTFTGEAGNGIGPYAKCPAGKKVISGGCASHFPTFLLTGSEMTKSNVHLEYNDAWQCNFMATSAGTYAYTVTAHCK